MASPIKRADLKRLDLVGAQKSGPLAIKTFLVELKKGLDQDQGNQAAIHLDLPFIENEAGAKNEYDFYLHSEAPTDARAISIADLTHLIDSISKWTHETHRELDELQTELLDPGDEISESQFEEPNRQALLKRQVDVLLQLYQEDSSPETEATEDSLENLLELVQKGTPKEVLDLWQNGSETNPSISSLLQQFNELPIGAQALGGQAPIPVEQLRQLSAAYIDRLQGLAKKRGTALKLLGVQKAVDRLSGNDFGLSGATDPTSKSGADAERVGVLIQTLTEVVGGLEKEDPNLDALKQTPEEDIGGSSRALPTEGQESGDSTQAVVPQNIPTRPDTDPQTPQTSQAPTQLALHQKSSQHYQRLSIHAGFLYNHVTDNLFHLYDLDNLPFEDRQFPPLLEYEIRQEIIKYLYNLSPEELVNLNRFDIAERLFRQLILGNPKLFVQIQDFIEFQNDELIPDEKLDPLHLEDGTPTYQQTVFVQRIVQKNDALSKESGAKESDSELRKATSRSVLNLSFQTSDESFAAGLVALGVETTRTTDVRRLVLTYIQTTGLDPLYVLANRNSKEIAALFAGIQLSPEQLEQFIPLVSSYWQYQVQKIQTLTNHKIVPDPKLVEAASAAIPPETTPPGVVPTKTTPQWFVTLVEEGRKTAISSAAENRDPRLYVLASLYSTAQITTTNSPERLLLAESLRELYRNDPEKIEEAIQEIVLIQKMQLSALKSKVAKLDHRQLLGFQTAVGNTAKKPEVGSVAEMGIKTNVGVETGIEISKATTVATATPTKTPSLIPNGLANFNALSFAERQILVDKLLAQLDTQEDSPQQVYELTYTGTTVVFGEAPQPAREVSQESPIPSTQLAVTPNTPSVPNPSPPPSFANQSSGVSQGIDRVKTLGSTLSQLKELGAVAGAGNPLASMVGQVVGKAAGAILGKEAGDVVDKSIKAAGVISTVGGLLSSAGGFLLSSGGWLLGLAGGPLGLIVGGLGLGAGAAIGSGLSSLFSNAVGKLPLGGATPTSGVGGVSGLNGVGGGVAPTATGSGIGLPTASIGTVTTVITVGGTAVLTAFTAIANHSAFLKPLPTLGDSNISPYIEIQKVADEGTKFATPTDIKYSIQIRAKEGFQIKLTEAPTDTFAATFTQRPGEPARDTTTVVPSSADHTAFLAGLTKFHTDFPVIGPDFLPVGTYTIPFGTNAGGVDYTDANVSNVFSVKFTVLDSSGQPVPDATGTLVASSGEVVCFGNCPQTQGGCWPMTGVIGQIPYEGATHADSALEQDAYDIMGPVGTPIYAPFVGEACPGSIDARYGIHATMVVRGSVYSGQSGDMYLIFAHLSNLNPDIQNSCVTITADMLSGGYQLGKSGNTGNSSGPHLHYEARWNTLGVLGKKHPSLLNQHVPELAKFRDPIRSCYE